jgi:hypothetical protein
MLKLNVRSFLKVRRYTFKSYLKSLGIYVTLTIGIMNAGKKVEL